ncbi:hypothetical protein Salmuc_03147 [Salipiger mucosus DSM 16094]|uniref:Uncharacterized protein n=1 Tax=Salipiger mucosus DSM 16094 TaxID=1123237 RepID=S9RCK4_9RHOB|nr:hypothetical protein Salmuc_03147 [Salipiger mucosus DSM 16094]
MHFHAPLLLAIYVAFDGAIFASSFRAIVDITSRPTLGISKQKHAPPQDEAFREDEHSVEHTPEKG